MGYYLTDQSPTQAPASPKTHTPLPRLQERGLRFYSTELSRWISRDPIGERGGMNVLVFVWNRPENYVDCLGLSGRMEHPPVSWPREIPSPVPPWEPVPPSIPPAFPDLPSTPPVSEPLPPFIPPAFPGAPGTPPVYDPPVPDLPDPPPRGSMRPCIGNRLCLFLCTETVTHFCAHRCLRLCVLLYPPWDGFCIAGCIGGCNRAAHRVCEAICDHFVPPYQ